MPLKKCKSQKSHEDPQSAFSTIYKNNKLLFALSNFGLVLKSSAIVGFSVFSQKVLDAITGSERYTLNYLILFACACLGALCAAAFIEYKFWTAFRCRALFSYRKNIYSRVLEKSIYSFTKEKAATYLSALSNDLGEIKDNYIELIPYAVELAFSFAVSIIVMFIYSVRLSIPALAVAVLPIIVSSFKMNEISICEEQLSEANSHFLDKFGEAIHGFPVIKSLMAENRITAWLSELNQAASDAFGKREHVEITVAYSAAVSGRIAKILFFLFCLAFSDKLSISAGVIVVYIQLMGNIMQVAISMPEVRARIKAGKSLINKHDKLLKENMREGIQRSITCNDGIEIRNLTAFYDSSKAGIKEISTFFKANGCYALIGESGSGKSTLLNVLSGFHREYSGDILYDGESIKDVSSTSIFNLVSTIYQDVFLFDASIKDNIALFGECQDEDLKYAIQKSGLSDLVSLKGLSYKCGNNGCNLSGGEKQRIAIARSLFNGKNVLLCDEITSSLDPKMGAKIIELLQKMEGRTRIIVTHDIYPELMDKFDGILVLKNGRIAEQGHYNQLLAQEGELCKIIKRNAL